MKLLVISLGIIVRAIIAWYSTFSVSIPEFSALTLNLESVRELIFDFKLQFGTNLADHLFDCLNSIWVLFVVLTVLDICIWFLLNYLKKILTRTNKLLDAKQDLIEFIIDINFLSPISLFSFASGSLQRIVFVLVLLVLCTSLKHKSAMAGCCAGLLCTYDLRFICIVPAVALLASRDNSFGIKHTLKAFISLGITTFLICCVFSNPADYLFKTPQLAAFGYVSHFTPRLDVLWCFSLEVFDEFADFLHTLLHWHMFFYVAPLIIIFINKNKEIPLLMTIAFILSDHHFTVEMVIFLLIVFSMFKISENLKFWTIVMVTSGVFVAMLILPLVYHTWIGITATNSNYSLGISFYFCICWYTYLVQLILTNMPEKTTDEGCAADLDGTKPEEEENEAHRHVEDESGFYHND
eukprot:TRINITY_DN3948_c0_g1_i1.p1 TRINITY_DN3948_c0_g1~~TRINITY_DN3948_c0_g1_i1.p1  ORF type:complete len:409 (-),score=45.67 TRINITY_DN3948_c0_g1_i1:146-1372(-)